MNSYWEVTMQRIGIWSFLLALMLNHANYTRSLGSDENRVLEVVALESVQTPCVSLALTEYDAVFLREEISKQRDIAEAADKKAKEAKDQERQHLKSLAVLAHRDLDRSEAKLKRLTKEALDGKRSLTIVHCWDGYAKAPMDVWVLDGKPSPKIRAGVMINAELEPITLNVIQVPPSGSMQWDLPLSAEFGTVHGLRLASMTPLNVVPDGFQEHKFSKATMPWVVVSVSDLKTIHPEVVESSRAEETMLHLTFTPSQGESLADIEFQLFALDAQNQPATELTPVGGVTVANMHRGSLYTFIDPRRRFAHGFRVEILSAHVHAAPPVSEPPSAHPAGK